MKKRTLLTSTERIELISRHKVERDKCVCDRIKAVLLYDDGYSYTEIVKILLLDNETIRRHVQDYEVMKKLKPANGGSDSLFSVEHSELLLLHLQEKTYRYVKDICAYVKARFSVNYTVSGMTKWLQANEFRYKKPQVYRRNLMLRSNKSLLDFTKN